MPHLRGASPASSGSLAALPTRRRCWTSSTPSRRSSSRTSAPVALTTSSAPRSARCSLTGIRPRCRAAEELIDTRSETYRAEYAAYYKAHRRARFARHPRRQSHRRPVPGVGMFSFGKNKTESASPASSTPTPSASCEGAGALGAGVDCKDIPAGRPRRAAARASSPTPTTLPCPPAKPSASSTGSWKRPRFAASRRRKSSAAASLMVVGGGSGIGREVALLAAARGAHIMVADRDLKAAARVADEPAPSPAKRPSAATAIDIRDRKTIHAALDATIANFGGLDILINTAAIFPSSADGVISDSHVGPHPRDQRHGQLLLADEASQRLRCAGHRRQHRAYQLRQRGRGQARHRGVRRLQGRAQPSGPRTCRYLLPQNPRQRHQSRNRSERFNHVSPRSRYRQSEKIQPRLRRERPATTNCATNWPSSMPAER